jgi:hypothetical protein
MWSMAYIFDKGHRRGSPHAGRRNARRPQRGAPGQGASKRARSAHPALKQRHFRGGLALRGLPSFVCRFAHRPQLPYASHFAFLRATNRRRRRSEARNHYFPVIAKEPKRLRQSRRRKGSDSQPHACAPHSRNCKRPGQSRNREGWD